MTKRARPPALLALAALLVVQPAAAQFLQGPAFGGANVPAGPLVLGIGESLVQSAPVEPLPLGWLPSAVEDFKPRTAPVVQLEAGVETVSLQVAPEPKESLPRTVGLRPRRFLSVSAASAVLWFASMRAATDMARKETYALLTQDGYVMSLWDKLNAWYLNDALLMPAAAALAYLAATALALIRGERASGGLKTGFGLAVGIGAILGVIDEILPPGTFDWLDLGLFGATGLAALLLSRLAWWPKSDGATGRRSNLAFLGAASLLAGAAVFYSLFWLPTGAALTALAAVLSAFSVLSLVVR